MCKKLQIGARATVFYILVDIKQRNYRKHKLCDKKLYYIGHKYFSFEIGLYGYKKSP
jgi:hypothetical protein